LAVQVELLAFALLLLLLLQVVERPDQPSRFLSPGRLPLFHLFTVDSETLTIIATHFCWTPQSASSERKKVWNGKARLSS
jgi:hypothetical protein